MKIFFKGLFIGLLGIIFFGSVALAVTTLSPQQGGTGISTTTIADVGKALTVSSTNPIVYKFTTLSSGGSANIGTSTINYFTFYNSVSSVTGTPAVQFINGILTIATTTSMTSTTITNLNATSVTSSFLTVNLTGYMKANGSGSQVTAAATIPSTDITGLGTMSTQNANTVAITGGTAVFTSETSTNQFTTNASSTNATTTNLFVSGALSLPSASVTNAMLNNSSLTVTAGTGLSGGGSVSLGNSVSLSLATSFTVTSVTTTNFFSTNASTTNATSSNLALLGVLSCNASNQALQTSAGGQISCGTLSTGGGGTGSVNTSTANFFAFYNTATTVTGTSFMQNSGAVIAFTTGTTFTSSTITNLNFGAATGTTLIITSVTSTNLNISGLTNLGNTVISNVTSTNLNVSGLTNLGNTTISNVTSTNGNFTGLTFGTGTGTTLTLTSGTSTNFFSTGLTFTNLNGTNATSTNLSVSGATVLASVTSTNLNVSGVTNLANTTITNVTTTNANVSGLLSVVGTSTLATTTAKMITIGTIGQAFVTGTTYLGIAASNTNYMEANIQNISNSASSSACWTATANNGTSSTFYGSLCTNNSNYSDPAFPLQGADDVSLDVNGGNLILETVSSTKGINIMTGGATMANLKMRITDGLVQVGTTTSIVAFDVNGTSTMQTTTIGHAPTTTWQILAGGHMNTTSTIPTLSSCGASPVINGSDLTGTVTPGTAATSCTVTFQLRYVNQHCTVSEQSMSLVNALSYSYTSSTLTMSQTGIAGQKLDYTCIDNF